MTDEAIREEVRKFLSDYDTAFQTFEGKNISPFYHAPCITVRGDGSVHCFQTRAEIEEFFHGVAQKYKSDGLGGGTFRDLEIQPIGNQCLLATVTWEQRRADNTILGTWRQSYNLVRVGKGLQMLAAIFHLK